MELEFHKMPELPVMSCKVLAKFTFHSHTNWECLNYSSRHQKMNCKDEYDDETVKKLQMNSLVDEWAYLPSV